MTLFYFYEMEDSLPCHKSHPAFSVKYSSHPPYRTSLTSIAVLFFCFSYIKSSLQGFLLKYYMHLLSLLHVIHDPLKLIRLAANPTAVCVCVCARARAPNIARHRLVKQVSGVFSAVYVLSNTQYVLKETRRLVLPRTSHNFLMKVCLIFIYHIYIILVLFKNTLSTFIKT
jgi:hypothetical protein